MKLELIGQGKIHYTYLSRKIGEELKQHFLMDIWFLTKIIFLVINVFGSKNNS